MMLRNLRTISLKRRMSMAQGLAVVLPDLFLSWRRFPAMLRSTLSRNRKSKLVSNLRNTRGMLQKEWSLSKLSPQQVVNFNGSGNILDLPSVSTGIFTPFQQVGKVLLVLAQPSPIDNNSELIYALNLELLIQRISQRFIYQQSEEVSHEFE